MAETWRIVEADWGQGLLREGEEADRIGYLQRVDNLIRNGAVRVAVTRCKRKGGMVDVARALCMAKRLPGARWFWNGHVLVAVGADGHFAGMLMPVVLW